MSGSNSFHCAGGGCFGRQSATSEAPKMLSQLQSLKKLQAE